MTKAILAEQIVPDGVSWSVSALHPSEMFWRQLRFGEFDVSEMSLSSLSIAVSQGNQDWVAVPVFTTRRFFHTGIMVRTDAAIETPMDLAGKRVGVPEYQQTAAVWSRGALQHEFGVAPDDLHWFMERSPSMSHGGATGFRPPPGVRLEYVPDDSSIAAMLAGKELDAALVYISDRNLVDRSQQAAASIPRLRTLFRDPMSEAVRYFGRTRILPVNHVVVIRAALARQYPWLALNIYSAFVEAKAAAREALTPLLVAWQQIGVLPDEVVTSLGEVDPLPYGLRTQRQAFEALSDYLYEQGLTPHHIGIDELVAPSCLDL
jgi:4,5-dihydroxyphthalate decarboxylase